MECGLLLGEVPVHLLGPDVVPLSKAPDILLPTPIVPRALYNSCPLLLVLDGLKADFTVCSACVTIKEGFILHYSILELWYHLY